MAAPKLIIGDIVRLKSGGPWMTVTKDKPEAGSKFVVASWFDASKLNSELFHKDVLEAKEPRPSTTEKTPDAPAS